MLSERVPTSAAAVVVEESELANLTSSTRPWKFSPCMPAMAASACATSSNLTKPNPRLLLVDTSRMTQQLSTVPKTSNARLSSSSSTSSARFLT